MASFDKEEKEGGLNDGRRCKEEGKTAGKVRNYKGILGKKNAYNLRFIASRSAEKGDSG